MDYLSLLIVSILYVLRSFWPVLASDTKKVGQEFLVERILGKTLKRDKLGKVPLCVLVLIKIAARWCLRRRVIFFAKPPRCVVIRLSMETLVTSKLTYLNEYLEGIYK